MSYEILKYLGGRGTRSSVSMSSYHYSKDARTESIEFSILTVYFGHQHYAELISFCEPRLTSRIQRLASLYVKELHHKVAAIFPLMQPITIQPPPLPLIGLPPEVSRGRGRQRTQLEAGKHRVPMQQRPHPLEMIQAENGPALCRNQGPFLPRGQVVAHLRCQEEACRGKPVLYVPHVDQDLSVGWAVVAS